MAIAGNDLHARASDAGVLSWLRPDLRGPEGLETPHLRPE